MSSLKDDYIQAKQEYEKIQMLKSEKVELFLTQKLAEDHIANLDAKTLEEYDQQFNQTHHNIILLVDQAKRRLEKAEYELLDQGIICLDKGIRRYYSAELKKQNVDRHALKHEILELIMQRI
ncbi:MULTISPECIES: hypothetical protein [Enterococcus]|uniref:Uncharacterized protein n=4 Tax=Enterococcus faecium TaxID=1352 RepID=A0A6S6MI35_ENTFC|nr:MULTISPECIES: hypothetical protein [Enterococcus]HAP4612820.1 hypothetical protein [Enterococcus faecalis]AUH49232.1 hypothetical protein CX663_15945 [Enterococcus faecium]EOG26340.1 hypothetical protein SMG_01359 [Enterococcus faecium EnGen0180]MBY3649457.1 hypothetical protein [Enterococcus faecium]MCE5842507.1 hypothetical protein [Enterococcus faecium]